MKTSQFLTTLPFLSLTLLTGSARLGAQELSAPAPAEGARAPLQLKVEAEIIIPSAAGGRLILRQVAKPDIQPAPPVVEPPLLPPTQRAARQLARRAASPVPRTTQLLWFHVTVHEAGVCYIEWWPDGGGEEYAAWSNADFRYMSMIPEFDLVNADTRYLVFIPTIVRPRPGSAPAEHPPIPADGPGFVLVKGDSSNRRAINPVTALHQLYKEEAATIRQDWEQDELARKAKAAQPPPPPGDIIMSFWPVQSEPAAPAAPKKTPAPAAR